MRNPKLVLVLKLDSHSKNASVGTLCNPCIHSQSSCIVLFYSVTLNCVTTKLAGTLSIPLMLGESTVPSRSRARPSRRAYGLYVTCPRTRTLGRHTPESEQRNKAGCEAPQRNRISRRKGCGNDVKYKLHARQISRRRAYGQ